MWPWAIFQKASMVQAFSFSFKGTSTFSLTIINFFLSSHRLHIVITQHPCALVTSYQNKMGFSHVGSRTSEIFYLEIIAASGHVEGSCCPRTLTNTRWFPSCYTEEIIISTCFIAVIVLLLSGLRFHCVKSLNFNVASIFLIKISQNTWSLFKPPHGLTGYNFQLFNLHQCVVMLQRFLWLETT